MSNFYGNASDFTLYHEERGRSVPVTWDDTKIEAALLVASEWLDNAYDQLWVGYATNGYTQERRWPRSEAYTVTFPSVIISDTTTPEAITKAVYEAAWREATTLGALSKDLTAPKYKSVTVSGALSVDYIIPSNPSDIQVKIPIIGSLMVPFIDPEKGMSGDYSGPASRV